MENFALHYQIEMLLPWAGALYALKTPWERKHALEWRSCAPIKLAYHRYIHTSQRCDRTAATSRVLQISYSVNVT